MPDSIIMAETPSTAEVKACKLSPEKALFRWRKMIIALLLFLGMVAGGLLFFSIPISRLAAPSLEFDMQVVLGGNRNQRSAVAHALWLRHRTPILVTGDEGIIYSELLALGVPESDLIHEPYATSTWENMHFSLPILKHHRVRRALIVSSWFHMTRVRGCFRSLPSDIEFTFFSDRIPGHFGSEEWSQLVRERCKSIYYLLVYRVNPWLPAMVSQSQARRRDRILDAK